MREIHRRKIKKLRKFYNKFFTEKCSKYSGKLVNWNFKNVNKFLLLSPQATCLIVLYLIENKYKILKNIHFQKKRQEMILIYYIADAK